MRPTPMMLSAVLMATGARAGPLDASRAAAQSALQQVREQTATMQRERALAVRQVQPARLAAVRVR